MKVRSCLQSFALMPAFAKEGSVTRALADSLETTLVSNLGGASVVRRNIGTNPLPATTWADAVFGPYTPAENQTPAPARGHRASARTGR